LANAAFGYLVVLVAWKIFERKNKDGWRAAALALPLACSSYVLGAAIWINTDNGAFLFYELAVAVAAFSQTVPLTAIAISAAIVMWRQMYLPVTGIFGLSWLLRDRRLSTVTVPLLAGIVPCALLAVYYLHWGGFVAPRFQVFNASGSQVASPLSALALVGMFFPFYWGYVHAAMVGLLRNHRVVVTVIALAVLVLWLSGPTDYYRYGGRWGAVIWTLAKHTLTIGSHAPVVLVFAILGALVLAALIFDARTRDEIPYDVIVLLLYVAGYSLQTGAYQRYIELPVLFTYGFVSARANSPLRYAWIGPVALGVAVGALSMLRAYGFVPRIFG
jgi:hypothetical protein